MAVQSPPYLSPTEVAPGIFLLPVPMAIPLKYVNCYLFRGEAGWTLVDTGFHDRLATDAWQRAFAELGIRPQDIDQILVTHYHPDHIGAAGWLQNLTGASVYMHDKELPLVEGAWGEGYTLGARTIQDFFTAEGMPHDVAAAIARHQINLWGSVQPLPELTPIPTGSHFRIGSSLYEVIWVPGHSDGLPVFWDQNSGILLANDMILDQITPNIGLFPGHRPNPLQDYLNSLERVEGLGAKVALPGHRAIIHDVAGRIQEIRDHHVERLILMEQACGQNGSTPWEVCQQVFPPARLTLHQVYFAMAETLAHLVYLEQQGRLVKLGSRYAQV